jgi:hypothetical protein
VSSGFGRLTDVSPVSPGGGSLQRAPVIRHPCRMPASLSLRTYRAATTFFLPEARVMEMVPTRPTTRLTCAGDSAAGASLSETHQTRHVRHVISQVS